jgi:16S rRNA (guanine527-N7)-methyltransferase
MKSILFLNNCNFFLRNKPKYKTFFFSKKIYFSKNLLNFYKKKNIKNSFLFLEQLILINQYINLISKKTESNIYRKHFLDTLTIVIFFRCFQKKKKKSTCLDIGTGSGFPGMLLSIFLPEIFFILVESIQKKSNFHKKVTQLFFLKNSKPLNMRIEGIGKLTQHREEYDFLTARAVSEINPLIQFSCSLLKKEGKLLLPKQTENINEELAQSETSLQKTQKKIKGFFLVSNIKNGRMILILQNKKK